MTLHPVKSGSRSIMWVVSPEMHLSSMALQILTRLRTYWRARHSQLYPLSSAPCSCSPCLPTLTSHKLISIRPLMAKQSDIQMYDITGQTLKEIAYRDTSFLPASTLAIVLAFISWILSNAAYLLIVVMLGMAFRQHHRRLVSHGWWMHNV